MAFFSWPRRRALTALEAGVSTRIVRGGKGGGGGISGSGAETHPDKTIKKRKEKLKTGPIFGRTNKTFIFDWMYFNKEFFFLLAYRTCTRTGSSRPFGVT
jgi:hypothetical protein